MFDDEGGFTVLGHRYRRITDLKETIGQGAILRFCPPLGPDAEWYMFEYRAAHKVMVCVNWLGFKAGLEHSVCLVPKSAFLPGTLNVPLGWFAENWHSSFTSDGRFEDAQFFKISS